MTIPRDDEPDWPREVKLAAWLEPEDKRLAMLENRVRNECIAAFRRWRYKEE